MGKQESRKSGKWGIGEAWKLGRVEAGKRRNRKVGNQGSGEAGKWGSGKVRKQVSREVERQGSRQAGKRGIEKQGRHPFLMRCPGVSKDDGCLSEGNHKSLSLPQLWSVARARHAVWKSEEGQGTNGHQKSSWVSRSPLNNVC